MSAEEGLTQLAKGIKNRKTGRTGMNEQSSRSHSVLTLTIDSIFHGVKRSSRLNLIDLAGSENQSTSTASSAKQLGEANAINLSLTFLSTLLRDIAANKPFLNYRNSKLTSLLRDSLGGNTRTCVIANVSSLRACEGQTLSTLKFAVNLKAVRNKPTKNEVISGDAQIAKLQTALSAANAELKKANTTKAQAVSEREKAIGQLKETEAKYGQCSTSSHLISFACRLSVSLITRVCGCVGVGVLHACVQITANHKLINCRYQ